MSEQGPEADAPNHRRPLWAPWRIAYIRATRYDTGCFLCDKGKTPEVDRDNYVIARGEHCYVLLNAFPYNSGHIMITPYRHVGALPELQAPERSELMDLSIRAQQALERAMEPQGFNLGCNLGRCAGAAIADHVHWHLVPRWSGDTNFMPVLAGVDCVPEALADTTRLLREHWPEA